MIAKARTQNLHFQIFCGAIMTVFFILSFFSDPAITMYGFLFALGCFLGSKLTIDIFRDSTGSQTK